MSRTVRSPLQRAAMNHNALIGLAVAIQKNAQAVLDAATASAMAKIHASAVKGGAYQLEQALRAERKDP